jgi:nucleoside-diphosphate-sugar epimerase
MKHTLITGASGFLGTVITDVYAKLGIPVLTLGKSHVNDLVVDLKGAVSKDDFPESISTVIHAAGKAHSIPRSEKEAQEFYDVNYSGTKRLCEALTQSRSNIEFFVFISTVSVYGLNKGELISESAELHGDTPYAKSKILAEEWLRNWAERNRVKLLILRLPLVVGPNPPGNLGAMIKGISSGRYVSIGKGNARKSMVWAEDIAMAIPNIDREGTYNLTDGRHPSFSELENIICKRLGKGKPINIPLVFANVLGFFGDLIGAKSPVNSDKILKITSSLTFDDSRAVRELKWKPSSVADRLINAP